MAQLEGMFEPTETIVINRACPTNCLEQCRRQVAERIKPEIASLICELVRLDILPQTVERMAALLDTIFQEVGLDTKDNGDKDVKDA